ncbi:hypothetical protein SO802_027803 [Lithocarpus litseifolius]|uniref:Protein FAR1-RELATED SEQUENCE n=1 Tax=Lithocarpus litseifolius TaxID=425828 RepID=A0AAW2BNJ7_9ROSI
MDENFVANDIHQLVRMSCFDLNELPQGEQMNDIVIASEIYQSVSRNCVDLNDLPNDGENNEICGEELVVWNEYPMEEIGVIEENEDINSIENKFEPFVGQCFLGEEETFIFYKNYANRYGFTLRKGRFVTKNGENIRRRQQLKRVDSSKEQQNRIFTRCGCKAHLRVALQKSFDIFSREWHVTKFVIDHNYELLSPSEVRFLPANRVINKEDKDRILLLKKGGLLVRKIIRVIELEKGVKHGDLPFSKGDIHNLYVKMRRMHAMNNAMGLLQLCKVAKEKNFKFQYAYTTDEESRLEHIFWAPTPYFDWCQKYGDVVVFYTTYKGNAYDMPFGIFVGINNHGKTILFGCALLRNETTSAFQWLMKTANLMKKSPKTILTDQDPWITEAISKELSSIKRTLCIWHITAKFSGWFMAILCSQYSNWCTDFYKLYKLDSCEEFEHQWSQVMAKYGMLTNKHVDLAIKDIEQTQSHDTMLEKYRGSSLRTLSLIEEQAHSVLTPYAFKKFQEELGRATQYSVLQENGIEFVLQYYEEKTSQKH